MSMLFLNLKLKKLLLLGTIFSLFAISIANAEDVKITIDTKGPIKFDVCNSSTEVLGVSRTVEIDSSLGPTLGTLGNQDTDLLKEKEVILTFDDGPSRKYTETILDALDAQCTKATFFIIGRSALLEPRIVQDIDRRGHTIAAHTWSHKRLDKIAIKKAKYEIELGFSAIERALGKPPSPLFRFPYLAENAELRKYLSQRNFTNTRINIDSRDFLTRNPSVVKKNVMRQLKSEHKGIILFHDIQPSTASALRSILTELRANNFKIVHLIAKQPAATTLNYNTIAKREALLLNVGTSENKELDTNTLLGDSGNTKYGDGGSGETDYDIEELKPSSSKVKQAKIKKDGLAPSTQKKSRTINDDSWAVSPFKLP